MPERAVLAIAARSCAPRPEWLVQTKRCERHLSVRLLCFVDLSSRLTTQPSHVGETVTRYFTTCCRPFASLSSTAMMFIIDFTLLRV